ncbi:MAG TPA: hypothetical protein PL169_18300 [Leptospiraceae bacterium]|nr:hypothetical protein [Leptospiraceae bacterium]HNM05964.1 hypothetical protein [Leptospiraceae bacterium]
MKYLFLFVFASFSIHSFPGDHITLTCIKHLAYKYESASGKLVKDKENLELYLNNLGDSPDAKIARTTAAQAIHKTLKDYPTLFEDPAIIAEIKQSIKDSGYNRDVPITKWGDSLSDWVDFYGWLPYSNFNYGMFTPGNQGFGGIAGGINSAQYSRSAELLGLMKEELARRGK